MNAPCAPEGRAEITVGREDGALRGDDHRALQAAVDYVAGLGGGTVRVGPGTYLMRNALTLRERVRVFGVPDKTMLVAAPGAESTLELDGDCNERQITLADPRGFEVGDGVSIQDAKKGGFAVTTATLTARLDAKTFSLSHPLYLDYLVSEGALARRAFPLVGAWGVRDAAIEGLALDGRRHETQPLNGCRGGGIFLFECKRFGIRGCAVRDYPGDGISFQVSDDVTVEDCVCEGNTGIGIHPGSGSQKPVLRRNTGARNDGDGLFVCWRVRQGLFEDNTFRENRGFGLSIGHKDTDNLFRRNSFLQNARGGACFRNESEPMGPHRNTFEENVFLDNGQDAGEGAGARAAILLQGHVRDLVFRRNEIGNSRPGTGPQVGFFKGRYVQGLVLEGNRFQNMAAEVEEER